MKKLIPIAFALITTYVHSQTPVYNFYELTDYLYLNDSTLMVPDSMKSGAAKDIDRMNLLWGPRLSPSGDVGTAATALINYATNFIPGVSNAGCGIEPVTWEEEGPFGNDATWNGQMHRIAFAPNYGINSNTVYAGSFYGGLWRSTNKGDLWELVNTDHDLPQTSVAGIALSHQDSNIIYISTGEGDLRSFENLTSTFNPNFEGQAPSFTTGIFRSTNYGQSWEGINNGFLSHFNGGGTTRKLIINPENDNTLFCATSLGLFRTQNAKASTPIWTRINFAGSSDHDFAGLAMHPTDTATIYAANKEDIFRSTDGGNTWLGITSIDSGLHIPALPHSFTVRRIKLAVSPADSSRLYAYINGSDKKVNNRFSPAIYIYMYKNNQWQELEYRNHDTLDVTEALAENWMGFAVSPVNPEAVYYGFTRVRGTNDFVNQNFEYKSRYVTTTFHADVHDLVFEPNVSTNPLLYCANHGGIDIKNTADPVSTEGWSRRRVGLNTNLIWAFDVSEIDKGIQVIGRQDNGTFRTSKSANGSYMWEIMDGGDGYGAQIMNEARVTRFLRSSNNLARGFGLPVEARAVALDINLNPPVIYPDPKNGVIGNISFLPFTFQSIEHPVSGKSIIGFNDLFSLPSNVIPQRPVTVNSWTVESDLYHHFEWRGWSQIREFAIAPSDSNYVYVATWGNRQLSSTELFRSTTGLRNGSYDSIHQAHLPSPPGKFQRITDNLPLTIVNGDTVPPYITGIAVSPLNAQHLWITVSGFEPNLRVLQSFDGGNSWQNADVNNDLPQVPANNIVYQEGTNNRIYIATDVGVYYTDGDIGCWKRYGDIPNVKVMELKIHTCSKKLYASTYGRGIWSADLLPETQPKSTLIISSNETWTENRILNRDLRIMPGAKLTVKDTLYMPAGGNIIVDANAILEVDGGTITNACGKTWQGIQLKGDRTKGQFPLNHPTHQAKLETKNGALIENAMVAVQNFGSALPFPTSGSLIQAQNTTFKNCRRSVHFIRHIQKDFSYFQECVFEWDSAYADIFEDSIIADNHIQMMGVRGVRFSGCEFYNNSDLHTFHLNKGNGIISIDAGYTVGPYCPNPAFPLINTCPTALVPGKFTQLNQGIYALHAASSMIPIVEDIEFYDNSIGMHAEALSNLRFNNNKLLYGALMKQGYDAPSLRLDHQFGFYADRSSDFEVEGNEFEGRSNPVMSVAGVGIKNAGIDANEVYKNTFKNNDVGELYKGQNRHPASPFQGLQFLCNENPVNNVNDVNIVVDLDADPQDRPDHGIRDHQGSTSPDFAADNLFSASPDPDQGHIKNESSNALNYHFVNPNSDRDPQHITPALVNKNLLGLSENLCGNLMHTFPIPTDPDGPIIIPLAPGMLVSYYDKRATYNDLLYNYFQQLDNGNTDSLINAINLSIPSQAQQMRDDLIAQSPYVSTQALEEAANSGVMTDALLLEVCLANPDATQSEGFLDMLEFDIPNPLPPSMIQLIYQSWGTETARTLLETQLGGYNAELGRMSKQILQHYFTDTLNHTDSIVSLFQSRNSLAADYRIVEIWIEAEDFTAANSAMQGILNDYVLDANQTAEHNNFQSYINLRSSIHTAGRNYLQLDEGELTTLRSIANAETGRSSAFARNILCFGYDECESPAPPATRLKSYPKRIYDMNPPIQSPIVDHQQISLSPNPATEQVRLSITEWEENGQWRFQLINLNGQRVLSVRVTSKVQQIDLANLPKGTYLYKVLNGTKELEYGKLMIQ